MEIPDSWIVDGIAKAIEKPGSEERAVKLAEMFRAKYHRLAPRAVTFLETVLAIIREP